MLIHNYIRAAERRAAAIEHRTRNLAMPSPMRLPKLLGVI